MASSQTSDEPSGGAKGRRNSRRSEVYCVCRKEAGRGFMIQCDACDEWFHGGCVEVTMAQGDRIDKYFCRACTDKNPNLQTTYKSMKEVEDVDENPPMRCNECINCLREPNCGECSRCQAGHGRCLRVQCLVSLSNNVVTKNARRSRRVEVVEVEEEVLSEASEAESSNSPSYVPSHASPARRAAGGGGVAVAAPQRSRGKKNKEPRMTKKQLRRASKKNENDEEEESEAVNTWNYESEADRQVHVPHYEPMQCLGPRCCYQNRPGSKYCSTECGVNLARARIQAHLPSAVKNYYSAQPVAARLAAKAAARREKEAEVLVKEKKALDDWHNLIVGYVDSIKQFSPNDEEAPKEHNNFMLFCSVCTAQYGNQVMAKHTERCYAKRERQTTYGSLEKCVVNPDNLLCDEFNKSDNSYCKRLRVGCPEHYKADIEEELQVCGWPNVWNREGSETFEQQFTNVEEIIADGFCGLSRKECKLHCGWITTTLGIVDSRRLAYYKRMDEFYEESKDENKTPDALLLMSNRAEYHQPLEQIIDSYEESAKAAEDTMQNIAL